MIRSSSATRRTRGKVAVTSLVLVGGLFLGGCASDATDAATTTAAAQQVSTSQTATTATSTDASTTAETISATTEAAEAFLATLSDEQREQVTYAFDDETKTTSWSNFPVAFVDRAGLNLADLTDEQKAAALNVLEALLSDEGYETVTGIMGGDEYLHENSSSTEESLGQYYIAFFGDPSDSSAWEVQFGGHHLGINATLDGAEDSVTFAPTHLGIQPAVYTDADGNEVQPFDGIYTDAFAFYDSLTDEQKATLYQGTSVANMVCAPGSTCDYPTGTGISGADLEDEQKQLLLEVIANWAGLADEQTMSDALAKIEATLDTTYVNWSGATTYDMSQGDGIYFQISGPDVYIEFAAQQGSAGADVSGVTTSGWGHVHTIYRDPTNDYAGSATQQAGSGPGSGAGAPGSGAGAPSGGMGAPGGGQPPAGEMGAPPAAG
ncbi:DUF3500 domain-containing protein [Rhodococcus sp. BP-252]|uniref:DUF3500 domain-containing protein n=1 Tax=unclassified Rhodococcus (in: high G+C Gram-positive bacteria) TaxID=192944 RepID=UPI001C9A9595|nr:DUF3500 domain-containing protein [Rhodococcus sp. BP-320]MBY6416217.1 DUF3500 domain-containing protein [Rhodococcus sp. BP-321]MBY6420212.1 DUF3500 domain-containing protein [Rhodococcus sp. BP-324]MBY6424891.1 DUF3500 domain-containing protein [Rhodococcus sp. BP-323]MBY6430403.1 DUF3500 domain-containing protein [Rhodococcus sp. BP-322]MBY6439278.1 DUF3500 domain-containing protein [Rhodococcus sp. BP-319]MBY6444240.1 DUF3500 domain-containing protein [Rhodococcus sp. BP-318]MBY644895